MSIGSGISRKIHTLTALTVLYGQDAVAQQWTIVTTPTVDIGSGGGGEEFSRIPRVLRLGNGTIVVPNEAAADIRLFDAQGRHLRTTGRRGSGPGEFQSVQTSFATALDSIFVWDWKQRRLSVLAPDGRFISASVLAPPKAQQQMPLPIAAFADGSLLGIVARTEGFPFKGLEGESRADSAAFVRFTRTGDVRWTTPSMVRSEVFGMPFKVGNERFLAPMGRPFGVQLTWSLNRDSLIASNGSQSNIRVLSPTGALARSIVLGSNGTVLSKTAIAAFTTAVSSLATEGGPSSDVYRELRAALSRSRVPFPERLPFHGEIMFDEAGMLWIQDADDTGLANLGLVQGAGSRWWTIRDRAGQLVARVQLPGRFRLDHVGRDQILGVWRDEDDTEHVRAYRLLRGK